MNDLGKMLVIIGVILAVAGVLIWSGGGRNWLGRLPGDLSVQKENVSFYFPITTCILLSVILTLLFHIFRK